MEETKPTVGRERWVAAALSLLSPGVGHIYCGRIVTGIVLFSSWLSFPLGLLAASFSPASLLALIALSILPLAAWLLVWLGGAWSAANHAGRVGQGYVLQDYNRPIVYLLLVCVGLTIGLGCIWGGRQFVGEVFYIPTRSMSPAFLPGDRIFVEKLVSTQRGPVRGDLVVFRRPTKFGKGFWIKRVIGLPGDNIRIEDNKIWINEKPLRQERRKNVSHKEVGLFSDQDGSFQVLTETNDQRRYPVLITNTAKKPTKVSLTVPSRTVFVLGDNRNNSRDSRQVGPIPLGDIIGCAKYRILPAVSWGRFGPIQ